MPLTEGLDERTNQTVKDRISKQMHGTEIEWDQILNHVEYSINTQYQASNNFIPFYLMFGRHPRPACAVGSEEEISEIQDDVFE